MSGSWHWRYLRQVPPPEISQPLLWSFPEHLVSTSPEPAVRPHKGTQSLGETGCEMDITGQGPTGAPHKPSDLRNQGSSSSPFSCQFLGAVLSHFQAGCSPQTPAALFSLCAAGLRSEGVSNSMGQMRDGGVKRQRHLSKVTWQVSGGLLFTSSDSSLCLFLCPVGRPLAWTLESRPGLEEEVGVLSQACA